jgi:hypothetical protein
MSDTFINASVNDGGLFDPQIFIGDNAVENSKLSYSGPAVCIVS